MVKTARLLKRAVHVDLEYCPRYDGKFRIIAAIKEPAVIVRILTHLDLLARAPAALTGRAAVSFPGGLIFKTLLEKHPS